LKLFAVGSGEMLGIMFIAPEFLDNQKEQRLKGQQ
jgi:hypothetical protein